MRNSETYELRNIILVNSSGEEYDIKSMMILLNIYESIFNNTMTGDLHINDGIGLVESIPIQGDEQIKVSFTIDGNHIWEHTFDVYSVENVENVGDRLQNIEMKLVSPAALINASKKIQKSYSGTATDHITNICTNMLEIETLISEPTENSKDIVVPNMRPFDYINYLAANSVVPNSNKEAANFLFYENRDSYNFLSLNTLFTFPEQFQFVYNSTLSNNVPLVTPFNVTGYHFEKLFDKWDNIASGMYASRLYTHNIITKEYRIHDYHYNAKFNETNHVDPDGKILHDVDYDPRAKSSFRGTNDELHPSISYKDTTGPRLSQMQQLDNNVLVLSCDGETYTTVGNIIDFRIPTITDVNDNITDERLSGRYLITAKRHSLTPIDYFTSLECIKDNFNI